MARSPDGVSADAEAPAADEERGFRLALDNFDGPFDLLLTLIGNRSMDVTEISLGRVTNEFIAYVRTLGGLTPMAARSFINVVSDARHPSPSAPMRLASGMRTSVR